MLEFSPRLTGSVVIEGDLTVSGGNSGSYSGSFQGDGSQLTGVVSSSFATTASFAVSASHEITLEVSSSYAESSSFSDTSTSSSFSDTSISSSFTQTASFALNADGSGFPFTGSAEISGSLTVSDAIRIPAGTSNERPDTTIIGELRFNTTTNRLEIYNGSIWLSLATEGLVNVIRATATAVAYNAVANRSGIAGWTTTSSMTRNYQHHGTGGDKDSAISMGYYSSQSTQSDYYNGSTWSTTSNCTLAMGIADGSGTSSNYLYVHGYPGNENRTVTWNGSVWSNTSNAIRNNYANSVVGDPSSARTSGGGPGDVSPANYNDSYNGTTWSSTSAIPRNVNYCTQSGTPNSSILFNDRTRSTTQVDYWNGSTWATTTSKNFKANNKLGFGKAINLTIAMQAYDPDTATTVSNTEIFNGVAWVTAAPMGVSSHSGTCNSSGNAAEIGGLVNGGGYDQTRTTISI